MLLNILEVFANVKRVIQFRASLTCTRHILSCLL